MLLSFVFVTTSALAGISSATASATAGLLFLEKEAAPVTLEGTGGATELKVGLNSIKCTAVKEAGTIGTAGETHPSLGLLTSTLTGCKENKGESKLACSSENAKGEKDAKEAILVQNADAHVLELLSTSNELEPGVAEILSSTLLVTCGIGKVEVRGAAFGLALGSLTADITEAKLHFAEGGEMCDEFDILCIAIAKNSPLEANFTGKFEKAAFIGECVPKANKMVLLAD
jgi:hypothetical protein